MGSRSRQRDNKRKIAICNFGNRVCPRFDLTCEMLVFDARNPQNEPIERIDISRASPEEVLHMLAEKEVEIIITGGIQKKFQEMLLHGNIDVIWGVAGEVGDVVEAYMKGTLYSGVGSLPTPKPLR